MSEQITKQYIAQFLPSNPTIIEAGAHIGRDTKKMITLWPEAKIHAFEPVPALFEQFTANLKDFPSVHCYPYALNDVTETSVFYVSSGRSTATSSLLEPKEYLSEHPTTVFQTITVPTITLDDWAAKFKIAHADFLWLDMQGSELDALKGGIQLLKTVRVIYTEVSFSERYKNNPLYSTIKLWLYKHGFSVQKEEFRNASWGNVLFLKS